jgi:hypothetical protein
MTDVVWRICGLMEWLLGKYGRGKSGESEGNMVRIFGENLRW